MMARKTLRTLTTRGERSPRVITRLLRFARNDRQENIVVARSRRRRGNLNSRELDPFSKVITNSMRRRSFRMHCPCHFERSEKSLPLD